MKINDIIPATKKPHLYEKGNAFMWTDEHISKQLLEVHLNPELDLASRKMSSIKKTADFILESQKSSGKLNILDLGCGPGLYTEIFAKSGHEVTGIDISKTSIDHAKKSAQDKNLKINYINANYLEANLETDKYDIIVLIYTDLGVLFPEERKVLLNRIYASLKKGGLFIFDVLKDNDLENKKTPRVWEVSGKGFWKDSPYMVLSDSFLYNEQKLILYQHLVIDLNDKINTYRFWTHFFSQNDIKKMLDTYNFKSINFYSDILPKDDMWNGDNVIFCIAEK